MRKNLMAMLIKMIIKIRLPAVLLAVALLVLPGTRPTPAQGSQGSQANVRHILAEMADLEQQLEQARQIHEAEMKRLDETDRSLESIESRLREREGLHAETKDFLENLDSQRQERSGELDDQITRSRRTLEVSGSALRRSMALLYGLEHSSQARPADLVTLAMLLETHYTRVQVASSRMLRLETERAELTRNRALAGVAARQHSIFTEYGLEQLHKRHKELAEQLEAGRVATDAQSQTVRSLTERREQLQALMTSLVESESHEATAESVTAMAEETPLPATEEADGGETDVIGNDGTAGPMISQTGSGQGPADSMSTEGARTLFWRAEPIGIRAVASGQVVFSGSFAGYRHLLIINHGGGWRSLYGNMISETVSQGDTVAVGQQIGVYQAGAGQRAEPFWFEVRNGKDVVPPDDWPALPSQWRQKLFMRLGGEQ